MEEEIVEHSVNVSDKSFEEDIPFQDGWKRIQVDEMKQFFSNWLDDNLQNEYEKDPEFYLKENEKRFYFKVIEEGYTDEPPDPDEGYHCIFVHIENERVEDL